MTVMQAAEFDAFISYSRLDVVWARNLAEELRLLGLKPWIDEEQVKPGMLFASAIEEALDNCGAMLLIVSPQSVASGWVKEEYNRALSLTKERPSFQLIPLLLADAELPGFLRTRQWVDFRDQSQYRPALYRVKWGITGLSSDMSSDPEGIQEATNARREADAEAEEEDDEIVSLRRDLRQLVRRLIANHGLDDETWSQAISSQYFLVQAARHLGMTEQDDYRNLLNRFLSSFTVNINDVFMLNDSQVLVTPGETLRILQCMEQEDRKDPYFRSSRKTQAKNIDPELLHSNYLHGLALGISSRTRSKFMQVIQESAIERLIYKKSSPAVLDSHGGWYPYRTPWVTARILIGFSQVDLSARQDGDHIKKVLDSALDSLVGRLSPEGIWRSGVGAWVSNWESTALCLEAFVATDLELRYSALVDEVATRVVDQEARWLTNPPNFYSEDGASDTLAAVLLTSTITRLITSNRLQLTHQGDLMVRHLSYLLASLEAITNTERITPRQSCTIQQIAAYCSSASALA